MPSRRVLWFLLVVAFFATGYAVARSRRDFVDFLVYRTAAERALRAEPLYREADGHYQFKYWPAFAFAAAPFAWIPDEAGRVVWYGLSVALLAVFLRRSINGLPDRRQSFAWLLGITCLLIGKFVVLELVNGQTNVLLGVLVILGLGAAVGGRPARAGALIATAVFVKPYALILLPWLAVTRRWRGLAAAAAVLACGLVAPALVYGWRRNLDLLYAWYRTVADTTQPNLLFPENISFATMWAKWLGPGPEASWLAAATAVLVLAGVGAVWLARRRVVAPDYLEVSLLLLLVPVLSPQGWDYVLILGLPAFALLVDRWRDLPVVCRVGAVASFAVTSFLIFDVWGRTMYLALMASSVQSVAVVVLAGCLMTLRARRAS